MYLIHYIEIEKKNYFRMPPAWESRCNRPGFSRATPDRRAEGNPTDQCHKSRGKLIDPRVRNNNKKEKKRN